MLEKKRKTKWKSVSIDRSIDDELAFLFLLVLFFLYTHMQVTFPIKSSPPACGSHFISYTFVLLFAPLPNQTTKLRAGRLRRRRRSRGGLVLLPQAAQRRSHDGGDDGVVGEAHAAARVEAVRGGIEPEVLQPVFWGVWGVMGWVSHMVVLHK